MTTSPTDRELLRELEHKTRNILASYNSLVRFLQSRVPVSETEVRDILNLHVDGLPKHEEAIRGLFATLLANGSGASPEPPGEQA